MYPGSPWLFAAITTTILWMIPFDYSGQIFGKIPFVANVDPSKKARYRSLEELTDPIRS